MDCNRDCFNCPFDDCVMDDISDSEIASIEKRNSKVSKPKKSVDKKKQERCKRYYQLHKAERIEYQKTYNEKRRQTLKGSEKKCTRCFKPLPDGFGFRMCEECRVKKRIYQNMKYRQKAI